MTCIQILYRFLVRLQNPTCTIRSASLSRNVKFEKEVTVEYGSHIQADLIGRLSYINKYCLIEKNTTIGRFCSIAYNAKIGLGKHPIDWASTHQFAYDSKYRLIEQSKTFENKTNKPTIIGNDVWIGANAIVLAGVKIGDGAIIGANSLVTNDVEPYSIVFGTPAKHQRFRFDNDIRKKLLEIQWWKWEDQKIKKNIDLFENPEKIISLIKK